MYTRGTPSDTEYAVMRAWEGLQAVGRVSPLSWVLNKLFTFGSILEYICTSVPRPENPPQP